MKNRHESDGIRCYPSLITKLYYILLIANTSFLGLGKLNKINHRGIFKNKTLVN